MAVAGSLLIGVILGLLLSNHEIVITFKNNKKDVN
jgi:hypothetical protein